MVIAVWGVGDRFSLAYVLGSMVTPYYALKMIMALVDTPFVYLGVRLLRGADGTGSATGEVA